jgi:hypothetical protein
MRRSRRRRRSRSQVLGHEGAYVGGLGAERRTTDLSGLTVHTELSGSPRGSELATREPDTRTLHDRGHLAALRENLVDIRSRGELWYLSLVIELGARIVELGLEGTDGCTVSRRTLGLAKRQLDGRRVGLEIARRVATVLEQRRVEGLDDLAIGVVHLEPLGRILDSGINHALIEALEEVLELLDGLIVIRTAETEIDGILGRRTGSLVVDIDTVGYRETGSLGHYVTSLITDIDGLTAIVKKLDRAELNLGHSDLGRNAN